MLHAIVEHYTWGIGWVCEAQPLMVWRGPRFEKCPVCGATRFRLLTPDGVVVISKFKDAQSDILEVTHETDRE